MIVQIFDSNFVGFLVFLGNFLLNGNFLLKGRRQ